MILKHLFIILQIIFQLVRNLTPDYEVGKLQHLIIIDEAHQILERSREQFTNNDFYIAKEQLENIFNKITKWNENILMVSSMRPIK